MWWAWAVAAVGPLVKRALIAVGIGVVSYASLSALANTLIQTVQQQWGGVSGSILQIASLAGIPDAMSLLCGALLARVALVAVTKLGRVAG